MKYPTEEIRAQKAAEAYQRQRANSKRRYEEAKKAEPTVEEWFKSTPIGKTVHAYPNL